MKTPKKNNRGAVLLLSALFTFFALLAAITLFKVLPTEFNAAQKSRVDLNAHYATDAGVKEAVAWLESQPASTVLDATTLSRYNSEFSQPRQLSGDWQYSSTLERIESGHFGITAEAFFRGRKVREAKAQVVFENFSQYAFFIDRWPFDGQTGRIGTDSLVFSFDENLVQGPFHTNDFFVLSAANGFSGNSQGQAFVSGPFAEMTHARATPSNSEFSDGNAYVDDGLTVNSNPLYLPFNDDGILEGRYQRIVEGGRGNLGRVEHIPFPDTARDADGTPLREKARGLGNTEFSNQGLLSLGAYVPTSSEGEVLGGVYVVGDSEILLRTDANGNQIQTISQAHSEEAYFERATVEVTSPRFVRTQTDNPPEFLEQVVIREEMQRVQVGFSEPTVSTGDGLTQPVRTPIYEERPVQVQHVIKVPFADVADPPPPPYTVYVEDVDNPLTYNTIVLNPIAEEDYDPNDPSHTIMLAEAGDRRYTVIEVTAPEGYNLPSGASVEGVVTAGRVPADHTIFVDHDGTYTVSSGNLNGVTFVDGNVLALSGVNRGAMAPDADGLVRSSGRVIAAAPEFRKSIEVTGHLLQYYNQGDQLQGPAQTLARGELPPNADHALALVAHDVELNPDFATNERRPLDIYAVIMAGHGRRDMDGNPLPLDGRQLTTGGFGTDASLLEPGSRLGRFRLVGGIIEAVARPWFKGESQAQRRGLEGELLYDAAAASGLTNLPSTNSVRLVRYSEYVQQ